VLRLASCGELHKSSNAGIERRDMSAQATIATCGKCGKHNTLLAALHGERGGPIMCLNCGLDWHAEYGRRRKAGRIVVKAIKLYFDAGGKFTDIDKLKLAASGIDLHGPYEPDTIGTQVGDITSELLEATVRLTHPDKHPPDRQDEAHRVTQELLALKPFTFPAPKAKPATPRPRDACAPVQPRTDSKPLRLEFPCELCADQIPHYYCAACKTEWEKRLEAKSERERAKQRHWRKQRRRIALAFRDKTTCAMC